MNQVTTSLPPFKTWEFFAACNHRLGRSELQKIFKRSTRQLERWYADPAYADQVSKNPLDRIIAILEKLCDKGKFDIARAGVAILAETVGCELRVRKDVEPDKESVEAEMLDDYPPLVRLHDAIREGHSLEAVRHLAGLAKGDIDETVTKYQQGLG